MKKFILKVGLFFLALIIVDRALGTIFAYMGDHAKGGYMGHHKYATDKANEDILIFGSSRAIHHYNPQILSDSLGMSCYNCGVDGNGIILFYGLWQMIKKHHKPKMIVYDISLSFDFCKGESNQKYLGWLRADYDRPGVKEIFAVIDPTEKYKMMSWLYRYNSKFLQNVTDYIHPIFGIEGNGYLPLKGEMDTMKIKKANGDNRQITLDEQKIYYLKKLIEETRGDSVKLVFAVSPSWYGEAQVQPIVDFFNNENAVFIDFSNKEKYTRHTEYFKDGQHLNSFGADEYTKDIIQYLRQYQ